MKFLLVTAFLISATAQAGLFQGLTSQLDGYYTNDKVIQVLDFEEEGEGGWVEATVTDELTITRVSRKKFKFEMSTWFTNGHSCYLEGEATKIGRKKFLYTGEESFGGEVCKSEILITKEGIKFMDESGACKMNNCGMRGYINETYFERD